jgi:hypothetical protein
VAPDAIRYLQKCSIVLSISIGYTRLVTINILNRSFHPSLNNSAGFSMAQEDGQEVAPNKNQVPARFTPPNPNISALSDRELKLSGADGDYTRKSKKGSKDGFAENRLSQRAEHAGMAAAGWSIWPRDCQADSESPVRATAARAPRPTGVTPGGGWTRPVLQPAGPVGPWRHRGPLTVRSRLHPAQKLIYADFDSFFGNASEGDLFGADQLACAIDTAAPCTVSDGSLR